MNENLEERLALLEDQLRKQKKPKHSKKWLYIVTFFLIATVSIGVFAWQYTNQEQLPISKKIVENAGFTVYYYPENMIPNQFKLDSESIEFSKGTLSMNLGNSTTDVIILQQTAPENRISLRDLPGFRSTPTDQGEAVIGMVNGKQTAIMNTATTLINITANKPITDDAMKQLVKNLQPLKS